MIIIHFKEVHGNILINQCGITVYGQNRVFNVNYAN